MTVALAIAGWLDLVATTVLAGGLVFAALVARPAPAGLRALRWAGGLVAFALGLEFVLTAARMHAVSGVGGLDLVTDLLESRWGSLWILRGLGLALLVTGRPGRRRLALLAVVWLMARSFQGHAGAHGTVPALVDWLHLLAASVWLGSLVQVTLVGDQVPARVAARVRGLATGSVLLLVPAGIYGGLLHVSSLAALLSPYGRVLIMKLVIAAAILVLGANSHFRHVPRMLAGDAAAPRALLRTVRFEVAIAALVLLLSAVLGVLPMPHLLAPQ